MKREPLRLLPVALLAACLLSQLGPIAAAAQNPDISTAARDNTRATGTVYDPTGKPMTDVDIWVQNDFAPAEKIRAKTRKTGSYLARGLSRLLDDRNVTGVRLRLTFEKPGYQSVIATTDVELNGLAGVYPILWPENTSAELSGICMKLVGRVLDGRAKGVKNTAIAVTGIDDEFRAETTTDKTGSYDLLLWNAPSAVRIEIGSFSEEVSLSASERSDLVQIARRDFNLGG